jgi:hypothetical protein
MTHSNSQALADAQRSRAAAAERLAAAAKALDKATRMHDEARSRVTQFEQADTATEIAQGEQLAAAIIAGKLTGTLPAATTPDAGRTAALQTARIYAAVTGKALDSLRRAHGIAGEELKASELSVRFEVFAALEREALALAAQIIEHDEKTIALREQLVAYVEAAIDGQPAPPGGRRQLPRALDEALRDPGMFAPPRYLEGMHAGGPHRARIEAARLRWMERIEELKAGEPAPVALNRA